MPLCPEETRLNQAQASEPGGGDGGGRCLPPTAVGRPSQPAVSPVSPRPCASHQKTSGHPRSKRRLRQLVRLSHPPGREAAPGPGRREAERSFTFCPCAPPRGKRKLKGRSGRCCPLTPPAGKAPGRPHSARQHRRGSRFPAALRAPASPSCRQRLGRTEGLRWAAGELRCRVDVVSRQRLRCEGRAPARASKPSWSCGTW